MKIGFFYQCGHRDNNIHATYVALKQLRKIYPLSPVSMWEDCHFKDNSGNNLYPLKTIGKEFNCEHHEIPYLDDYPTKNCYAVDLKTNLQFLDRMYYAANNELRDCEWIMLLEDDVWIQKEIENFPDGDFCGYIAGSLMPGGVVFKREALLKAYSLHTNIDWENATRHEKMYTDHFLSLVFRNGGCIQSPVWKELGTFNLKSPHDHSVLHGLKLFYKVHYGVVEKIYENTGKSELSYFPEIIKHPSIQQFIDNYNVDIFI